MSDLFDGLLAQALAPPARDPDRAFVARVSSAVALDKALHAERRATARAIASQALALLAVAAGLVLLGRAASVADFVAESPAVALAALLSGFALLVAVLGSQTSRPNARDMVGSNHFKDLGRLRS